MSHFGMRVWERVEGESPRAYSAFQCYRDLGPERSLATASELYYGRQSGGKAAGQISKWSRQFEWVDRARAYDDFLDMVRQDAVEKRTRNRAAELAERQERLRERCLEIGEKAADKAAQMIEWPLAEQTLVRPGPDGEMATYLLVPARWNKNTASHYYRMASKAAGEPEKIALTDPTGEHEFGKSPEEIDEEFDDLLRSRGVDPDAEEAG